MLGCVLGSGGMEGRGRERESVYPLRLSRYRTKCSERVPPGGVQMQGPSAPDLTAWTSAAQSSAASHLWLLST